MPERVYHHRKAQYNVEVAAHLRGQDELHRLGRHGLYAALHLVDSMLAVSDLPKDEQHPRKHTANAGQGNGGRGRNQLIASEFGAIRKAYRSLEEASRRARYDLELLDPHAYKRLQDQCQEIARYEQAMSKVLDQSA